jgi:hypothetical protein
MMMTLTMTVTPTSDCRISKISELDQAMEKHMTYLVHTKYRPFSYRDFLVFEVEEKEYRMSHGTFRNKISGLKKAGLVELAYISCIAFYTLKGKRFGRVMTPNHAGVYYSKTDPLVRLIDTLPMNKAALHDIRLKFKVHGIWSAFSAHYPKFPVRAVSNDICIPSWTIGNLLIRAIVHKTDTVTVMVACSLAPVAVDVNGLIHLSNSLVRVEERLAALIGANDYVHGNSVDGDKVALDDDSVDREHLTIPEYTCWTVTMWHFGADASVEYTGDKFSVTWDIGQNALVKAYTKETKNNSRRARVRLERQEYPRKIFTEAVEEKLK